MTSNLNQLTNPRSATDRPRAPIIETRDPTDLLHNPTIDPRDAIDNPRDATDDPRNAFDNPRDSTELPGDPNIDPPDPSDPLRISTIGRRSPITREIEPTISPRGHASGGPKVAAVHDGAPAPRPAALTSSAEIPTAADLPISIRQRHPRISAEVTAAPTTCAIAEKSKIQNWKSKIDSSANGRMEPDNAPFADHSKIQNPNSKLSRPIDDGIQNGASAPQPPAAAPSLSIRPANATDFAPLAFFFDTALRRDYFLRRGQLEEILTSDRHRVYIAEIDSVLVGAAITTRGNRLVNALVHPNFRGIGIGRALVEQSGAMEVRAKLDMTTGDPRPFYRSLGFKGTPEFNGTGNIQVMKKPASQEARMKRDPDPRKRDPGITRRDPGMKQTGGYLKTAESNKSVQVICRKPLNSRFDFSQRMHSRR